MKYQISKIITHEHSERSNRRMTEYQNLNMKSKTLRFVFWLFVVSYLSLVSSSASAHLDGVFWLPGDPIVTCGIDAGVVSGRNLDSSYAAPCTQCELLHLTRHLVDFVLVAAAPILATFFFVVAGLYIMLGGANPGMLSQGKRIFKDTFIGILIVMMAWLITNTLIRTLMDPSITSNSNWWEVSCSSVGLKP